MKKRLLLITPKFYDVETFLILALENMGFDVIWFENKDLAFDYHGTKSKMKILRRIYYFLFLPGKRYINSQLKKIDNLYFDILFSINGHTICPYLFKKLKEQNPELHSILYLWDSFSMYSWENEIRLFDKVYTYDHEDSEIYGLNYHPNFFVDDTLAVNVEKQHDLFFVGKFSAERFRILENIINQASELSINFFIRVLPAFKNLLHSRWIYLFIKMAGIETHWTKNYLLNYEIIEGIVRRDYIISRSIKYEEAHKELLSSNVILDIPFSTQNGYSHRLIESLAMGKKVVTTNSFIQKESFFNPDQIKIIDNDNPVIDCLWIKERVDFQRNKYFADLELSKWLKSILDVEIA